MGLPCLDRPDGLLGLSTLRAGLGRVSRRHDGTRASRSDPELCGKGVRLRQALQVRDDIGNQQGVLKVETNVRIWAMVLAAGWMAVATNSSFGQAASKTPVAVVDIGHIFKNHPRFKRAMDQVKAQVKASEDSFLLRQKEVEKQAQQLKTFKPDSAEYKQLEADAARSQAQIQAEMALKRKEFLEKEALVYYTIYNEIQKEVKALADTYNIGLVLRFSADAMDPADRQSVLQGVNRPVVYQRNLNITYQILDRLQRASGSQRTARTTQPGTAGRQ